MNLFKKIFISTLAGAAAMISLDAVQPSKAEACGCFAPPDPSVPIVQAGERILFSQENGMVTAHIQVQYSGPAEEFGWLLPMPSVPEMELGVDELFTQLIDSTQPEYTMTANYVGECPFDPQRSGPLSGSAENDSGGAGPPDGNGSPLVLRASVGPYDYAVLRADSKQPMFDWLAAEGFFVPAGTDSVSDPYIKPGAFFLALKLRSGETTGDLQPVVLKYESDLPMIPIILTSVAADPDMGVQVWIAGDDRAIPRNFYHTRINDALLDWPNAAANYAQVINDAVDEAEGHHSFVTEYAGASAVMVDRLDPSFRFGNVAELKNISDAELFIDYLNQNGYPTQTNTGFFAPTYSSQMLTILRRHLPVPSRLSAELEAWGQTDSNYYTEIGYYLGSFRQERPELFSDLDLSFDANLLASEIEERVVEPTRFAGQTFRDFSYLTRMFTTLSPNEMTKDPVFSFNPDLPEVSNEHRGEITYFCNQVANPTLTTTPATLVTEAGFVVHYPSGVGANPAEDLASLPSSEAIEILREEGPPNVIIDNKALIAGTLPMDKGGCQTGGGSGLLGALFALFGLALGRRRKDASQLDD